MSSIITPLWRSSKSCRSSALKELATLAVPELIGFKSENRVPDLGSFERIAVHTEDRLSFGSPVLSSSAKLGMLSDALESSGSVIVGVLGRLCLSTPSSRLQDALIPIAFIDFEKLTHRIFRSAQWML